MMQALTYKFDLPRALLILFTSWLVYASCQEDFLLPAAAFLIILISAGSRSAKNKKKTEPLENKFSWATALSLSLLMGWIWITLFPRQYPSDFMQSYAIFILQSGSIFLVLFLWFSPRYLYRAFFLKLLPWLTVALSVNVAFTWNSGTFSGICFVLFCLVNAGVFLTQTGDTGHLPPKVREPLWKKVFLFLSFALTAAVIFFGFFWAFHIGDEVYSRLIKDYTLIYRRHPFLNFSPVMDIQGPGISGNDIRPVLEVERNNRPSLYLLTQYFKDYDNGTWMVPEDVPRYAMPEQHAEGAPTLDLKMLVTLKDIVPVPKGTKTVTGYNGPYEQNLDGLVFSLQKSIHQVTISPYDNLLSPHDSARDLKEYTVLDPEFKKELRPYLNYIIGSETNPRVIARKVEQYFRTNFRYSLNVNFKADDAGIIYILNQRPPAYCSFFASTMAVLLRAADIPTRLTVGFLATEKIGKNDEHFLVRVRDAHAWVEAYLPQPDFPNRSAWQRFDPTPPDDRLRALNDGKMINRTADAIYLAIVRFRSDFKNLESEKLLGWLMLLLVVLVFMRNYRAIWYFLQWCVSPNRKSWQPRKLTRKDYVRTYQDLETILRRRFKTRQQHAETHAEFVQRLRRHHPDQSALIESIEAFLALYQDNRFGEKDRPELPAKLQEIKTTSS